MIGAALLALVAGAAGQLQREAIDDLDVALAAAALAGLMLVAALAGALVTTRVAAPLGAPPRKGPESTARMAWAWLVCASLVPATFALTEWRAHLRLAEQLAPALEGQDLRLQGRIVGLPQITPAGTHFEFEVEQAAQGGRDVRVPPRLSMTWSAGWDGEALVAGPAHALAAGQRWRFDARLKAIHGHLNPHGFDLEAWLFERGIGGAGQVRAQARLLAAHDGRWLDRARQAVRDAVLLDVEPPAAAGVLAALAVGDQAAIDRQDWNTFRRTGVAHLMSISGLHVTLFAWLAAAVLGMAWRRWPAALHRVPAPLAARWGGLVLAAAYAGLAGWGIPAQRTVVMMAVVCVLRSAGRRWPWGLVWLAAGTAVVVIDPWALLQAGFWLSFVAVGLLMASEPARALGGRGGWRARLGEAARSQVVATLGLAPLSALFFNELSAVGLLANVLAIPWVTFVVMPLSLLGMVVPGGWALGAAAVQALMALLDAVAAWPWAGWSVAAVPVLTMAAGLLGGALCIAPLPRRLRLAGLCLVLPVLWPVATPLPFGDMDILAADVGQGSAVLLRTRHHRLLYDAGPRYGPDTDAGARVLLPLMRGRGDAALDLLVLTHQDTDHVGGAASVLDTQRVQASLSSLDAAHALRQRLPLHRRCDAGQAWEWDGVRFEVLHPLADDHDRPLSPNAKSCVLRVTDARGRRVLLTGDIEAAQEAELLQRLPADALRADWLVLPHHGSRTSSTDAFLDAVAPRVAIVQAGYRSRFGHPHPSVLARLAARGITVRRTDRCGAWHGAGDNVPVRESPGKPPDGAATGTPVGTAGERSGAEGRCEREMRRRYWHHRMPPM